MYHHLKMGFMQVSARKIHKRAINAFLELTNMHIWGIVNVCKTVGCDGWCK